MTVYPVFHHYTNTVEFWKELVGICVTEELAMALVAELEKTPHNPNEECWDWTDMDLLDKLPDLF